MGDFFSDFGKILSPALDVAFPAFSIPNKMLAGEALNLGKNVIGEGQNQIPGATTPTQNPAIAGILQNQKTNAENYRKNLSQTSDQIYGNYAADAKRQLAQNIKDTQRDFNRRGLLRSGMRLGAEYGDRATTANDLASTRQNINQGLLGTADQMDSSVINTAGGMAGLGYGLGSNITNAAGANLKNNIKDLEQQQKFYGSLGDNLGTLAGYISRLKPSGSYADSSPGMYRSTPFLD